VDRPGIRALGGPDGAGDGGPERAERAVVGGGLRQILIKPDGVTVQLLLIGGLVRARVAELRRAVGCEREQGTRASLASITAGW